MIDTDKEKEEITDTEKVYFQKVEEIELYFGKKPCEAVRTDLKEHNWGLASYKEMLVLRI